MYILKPNAQIHSIQPLANRTPAVYNNSCVVVYAHCKIILVILVLARKRNILVRTSQTRIKKKDSETVCTHFKLYTITREIGLDVALLDWSPVPNTTPYYYFCLNMTFSLYQKHFLQKRSLLTRLYK